MQSTSSKDVIQSNEPWIQRLYAKELVLGLIALCV